MLCAAAALAQAAAIADLPTATIFTHGESPNCTCIRIPSLVLSNDTVLLAFAMCRQGTGDNCQPLRPAGVPAGATTTLIYKRSSDGGSSWGTLTTVPGSEHDPNGGPRAVALRDSSTVLLTNSHGKLWRSDDRGLTWARPVEMFSPAQGLGGGGVMLELSASHPTHPSRLVASFDATLPFPACSPGGSPYDAACEYASSYWSDDGQTWTLSSSRIPKLDESEVLEMADGALVMLSRNQDGSCAVDLGRCKTHQDGGCMCVAHTVSTDAVSHSSVTSHQRHALTVAPSGRDVGQHEQVSALALGRQLPRRRAGEQRLVLLCDAGVHRPGADAQPRAEVLHVQGPLSRKCSSSLAGLPEKAKAPDAKAFAQTDRAPNRINGTIFKATNAALSDWAVHERVTIGEADGGHQTYAAFGYSSLSPLPTGLWPNAIGLMYETGAPDCGYDPHQSTATGMGSSTSACKIVFAVVDV